MSWADSLLLFLLLKLRKKMERIRSEENMEELHFLYRHVTIHFIDSTILTFTVVRPKNPRKQFYMIGVMPMIALF